MTSSVHVIVVIPNYSLYFSKRNHREKSRPCFFYKIASILSGINICAYIFYTTVFLQMPSVMAIK